MFAAFHIPDFSVVAALRCLERCVRHHPAGMLATSGGKRAPEKLPLLALNRAAREAGIQTGWPLGRALVRCPDLRVLERNPTAEANLTHWLLALSAQAAGELELTRPDTVIADLAARPDRAIWQPDTTTCGDCEVWWTIADTPDLAALTARMETLRGRRIGSAEIATVGVKHLTLLGAGTRDLEVLELWGVHTMSQLIALPKRALTERLGPQAKTWLEILQGTIRRPIRYYTEHEKFLYSHEFEEVTNSLETIVWTIKRLLSSIESSGRLKHLCVSCLKLSLDLTDGSAVVRDLRLAEPQARAEGMLAVVRPYLEALRLPAAVARVTVEAATTFATAAQREWLGRRELPQPERWAETVGRLEALLGAERVGIPMPADSFRPDGFTLHPALAGGTGGSAWGGFQPELAVPLRRYRPALTVAVAADARRGRRWPLAVLTGPHTGRITGARGPFPASGQWWEPAAGWQRLEWDVAVEERDLLRLAWLPQGEWKVEGTYG